MIVVLFEAELRDGAQHGYLDAAAQLRPQLDAIDGFQAIERYASLADPRRLLSLSSWRDEQAVRTWRALEAHRQAQRRGREELFADYRLRVAEVRRDYGMTRRAEAPADARERHEGMP